MENINTNKTAGIWNSVPDLGGSNGALKALAKNVANLKLSRPEMKRVVAKVVAERHGLGDVADYKGYMYYVKPDRINMNQLISQSKEAFDEMMQQQRHQENLQQQQQRKATGKMSGSHRSQNVGGGASKKKEVSRKSSTAVFQLQNWGHKSLNGVIIDETHLPRGGKEILLAVNRRMVAVDGGSKKKNTDTKMPAAVPVKKQPEQLKPTSGKISAMKKLSLPSTTPPPAAVKQCLVKKIPAKGANPIAPKVVDFPPVTLKDELYRLPAGSSFHPPPATPIESDTKKPLARSKSKNSINRKQTVQHQRNYDKPWLVSRNKRHNRHKIEGGAAASVGAVGAGGDAEDLGQSSGQKLPAHSSGLSQALSRPRTRLSYQPPGGAGGTNKKLKESASTFNVSKTAIAGRVNPKPKGGKSKAKQVKQHSQAVSTSQAGRKETNTTPQNRGSRVNKVFQARLIKDLLREEAIDEPERLEAGSIRRPIRDKKRREKKPKMDAQQQQEEDGEAATAIIEVCAEKVTQQNKPSKAGKNKLKVKPKEKPVAKASRYKRIPKVAIPSAKAATPKATFALASPQNPPQSINPQSKRRYLLRTHRQRRIPVASSLGSIGNIRWNKQNVGSGSGAAAASGAGGGTSTSILTPAKRNLTIAFMNKRLEERNQRNQVLIPWK